jgi:RND family efflux transporter MFP subunit
MPGTLETDNESGLYARVQGFVKKLHADIGQQVKAGQLLAEIDTPELDEQIRQAEADLANSRATEELARATAARWQQLLDQKLVARQTADEKFADAKVRRAAVDSQSANVARLRQLQSFRRVTAPFAGTITARGVNVGQLVTAAGAVNGASSGTASSLYRISSAGALRLFLAVPQAQAGMMKPGTTAKVSVPEQPGKSYSAHVVRNSGSIDPVSRSLRVELAVDDASGSLLPGAYVQAAFEITAAADVLRLPVSTLIFRGKGTMVAVATADNTASLRKVQLGRDFGTEFEVVDGLSANDAVILNPPDSLVDGQAVKVVSPEQKPAS